MWGRESFSRKRAVLVSIEALPRLAQSTTILLGVLSRMVWCAQ